MVVSQQSSQFFQPASSVVGPTRGEFKSKQVHFDKSVAPVPDRSVLNEWIKGQYSSSPVDLNALKANFQSVYKSVIHFPGISPEDLPGPVRNKFHSFFPQADYPKKRIGRAHDAGTFIKVFNTASPVFDPKLESTLDPLLPSFFKLLEKTYQLPALQISRFQEIFTPFKKVILEPHLNQNPFTRIVSRTHI